MLDRFRHETASAFAPRKFADKEKRYMTKLHGVAGFARERGHVLGLVACHEFRNALRDVVALLVESVFPE